jgi:transposase
MGRPRKLRPDWNALATIWTISDAMWRVIYPILAELDPPKKTGRPRVDARRTLDAIMFRLRTGCQWNQLPERLPDDSSVHRTFQRWVRLGLFERIWATLVAACEELGGVDWEWQAVDGMMGKARLGGPHRAQSDRSRQTRSEAQPAGRSGGRAAGGGDCWRQCA